MIKGVVEFQGVAVFVCKIKNGKSTEIIIVKVSTKQKKENKNYREIHNTCAFQ